MYEELIKRLRERAAWINFPHHGEESPTEDAKLMMDATAAIEEMNRMERDLRDCRNELCLRCGEYKRRHLGACDGCRWLEVGDA